MIDIAVIGTGNIFLGDDGVGVHFVNYIREKNSLPEDVALIDCGVDTFGIASYLLDSKRAIIIDACNFGEDPPGSLRVIDVDCSKLTKNEKEISIHSSSVKDAVLIASAVRTDLSVVIYAIQIEKLDSSIEISSRLRENFSLFEAQLLNEIKKFKEEGIR